MTYNVWVINDLWLKINFLICFLLKLNLLCAVSSFILGFRLTNELALWLAVQQTIEERARWLFICSRENVSGQTESRTPFSNNMRYWLHSRLVFDRMRSWIESRKTSREWFEDEKRMCCYYVCFAQAKKCW